MKTALVMAGGTGGHIFPGLAVAEALRETGWQVHWLGAAGGMECRMVPKQGFAVETINFSGVRGKGWLSVAFLPMRLIRAFWQSIRVIKKIQPHVVIGFGGYVTFPAGLMAVLLGKPLILHEQNSVAGLANRVLAQIADRVFTSFPAVLKNGECVGNPLRKAFLNQEPPELRFARRSGRMSLLVVGGSLGAKALNECIPRAIASMPQEQRPSVTHQGGEKQIEQLRAAYASAGVQAELTPFIEDTATAFAHADLIICRAGASTVSEIAAVGAPAVFVPYPFAVDDHQMHNAKFLCDQNAGVLLAQNDLNPERIVNLLQKEERKAHYLRGIRAYSLKKAEATAAIIQACETLR